MLVGYLVGWHLCVAATGVPTSGNYDTSAAVVLMRLITEMGAFVGLFPRTRLPFYAILPSPYFGRWLHTQLL